MNRSRLLLFGIAVFCIGTCMTLGCQNTENRSSYMDGRNRSDDTQKLTKESVGETVTVTVPTKYGEKDVTGTVKRVDPDKDVVVIDMDLGGWIATKKIMLTEIIDVTHYKKKDTSTSQDEPEPVRFSTETAKGGEAPKIIWLNFQHQHLLVPAKEDEDPGCLADMGPHIRDNYSGIIFADKSSTGVLRVPVPQEAEANLIKWQWHGHLITGNKPNFHDKLLKMNNDGEVEIDFADTQLPATLVLIGTQAWAKERASATDTPIPPRTLSLRVLDAGKANGILSNNSSLVTEIDTGGNRMKIASAPLTESEFLILAYDVAGQHKGLMDQIRYSVQDGILEPAFVLEISSDDRGVWQLASGHPVAPIMSHDTPDTSEINLELGPNKYEPGFPAPMLHRVSVPEKALVRADIDIRAYGKKPGVEHTLILAHGSPDMAGKDITFAPDPIKIGDDIKYTSRQLNFSSLSKSSFPAQVPVWHVVGTTWTETGGLLRNKDVIRTKARKTTTRRITFPPANAPHIKFIRFTGPEFDLSSGIVPSGLAPYGGTIGRGGAGAPLSFEVGSSTTVDPDKGRKPTLPPLNTGTTLAFGGVGFVGPINVAPPKASAVASIGDITLNCCCNKGGGCNEQNESVPNGPGQTQHEGSPYGHTRGSKPGESPFEEFQDGYPK